ncbi:MAG: DUF2087 domain-containing protein [Pseudomonadota bacterium]
MSRTLELASDPASPDVVAAALRKALPEARLHRIPKHPGRQAIVLGLMATRLERRYPYTELELNEELTAGLAHFRADVDHVTCRRYLVDLGFLKRDRAGNRYFLNFPKLEATLSIDAQEQAEELIAAALAAATDRLTNRRAP